MAQTLIRGSTQILDGSITAAKLAGSIPTSALTDGASFIRAGGSVAFSADQSMGNFKLTNVADPVSSQDAVNLRTAQALINGVSLRSVRGVVTTNQALTGALTSDGITYNTGQLALLTNQTTPSQNGPWAINTAGAWTRPSLWAAASTQKSTMFFVEEGTTYHDTKWIVITDAITVDTTSVTISQDLSGTSYTNGNGLSLTGSVFAVKNGNGITFDGSQNIQVNPDSNGLLTVGAGGVRIAASSSNAQIIVSNGSNNPAWVSASGDITLATTGAMTVNHTAGSGFLKYGDLVTDEIPSGAINGSNTAFTLASTPQNGSLKLYVNGVKQYPGAGNDYTISGTSITMLYVLVAGDRLTADYTK